MNDIVLLTECLSWEYWKMATRNLRSLKLTKWKQWLFLWFLLFFFFFHLVVGEDQGIEGLSQWCALETPFLTKTLYNGYLYLYLIKKKQNKTKPKMFKWIWTPLYFLESKLKIYLLLFFKVYFSLFWERQSTSGRGAEREETETPSRLWAASMEPDMGVELTKLWDHNLSWNHESDA